jgi:hypothetical protein
LVEIGVAAVELANTEGELAVFVDSYSACEEVIVARVAVGGVVDQSDTLTV